MVGADLLSGYCCGDRCDQRLAENREMQGKSRRKKNNQVEERKGGGVLTWQ